MQKKRERETEREVRARFHQGGVNANEAKKSRESRSRADREETEVVREFYATKEKHILVDEGIMAEKRPRKVSGSSKKKRKKKAGYRIPTVCLRV